MLKHKFKFLLGLLTVVAVVAIPFSVFCADGQIKIGQTSSTTFPITISSSGSYVLTSNLTVSTGVSAISIAANNVTIDLNGHTIDGPWSGSGYGIYASSSRRNIAVMNGTVRDFGNEGVYLGGYNNIVKDVRAYRNGTYGILVIRSTVDNCTAYFNGGDGIKASDSTVTNCTATKNTGHGIHADDSTVTNCTFFGNTDCGIEAYKSTVTNCTANNNTNNYGIYAVRSTVTNCTANNNNYGIYGYCSTVTNCTAYSNDGDGIVGSQTSRIESNNLRYNTGYGLCLLNSDNYAIRNTASGNASGNFYAVGTHHMPTTGDNANYGF